MGLYDTLNYTHNVIFLTYDLLEGRPIDNITMNNILLFYHYMQIDSILSGVQYSNRTQKTSKCG